MYAKVTVKPSLRMPSKGNGGRNEGEEKCWDLSRCFSELGVVTGNNGLAKLLSLQNTTHRQEESFV